jgi:hypothetical protein
MINKDRANNERGKTRFTTELRGKEIRILSASGWDECGGQEGQDAVLDPAGRRPAPAKGQKPL